MVETPSRMRHAVQRLQDLIYHSQMWYVRSGFSTCPGSGVGEIQIAFVGSSECMKPCVRSTPTAFHFVHEVALIFRHLLLLHDEAHLECLNLQFVLSRRVSLDFIVETGRDDPRAHGHLASLELCQAATPEQACHLVALLLLPNRRQSLVVHRRALVLWVGLSQVDP